MTLTYLGGLFRAGTIHNALILAPLSVLRSWEKESKVVLSLVAPQTLVRTVTSSSTYTKAMRQQTLQHALAASSSDQQRPCLIITTYGLVRESTRDFQHRTHFWDYVILDEGHTIKNPKSAITRACHEICHPHRGSNTHRLLLSGTPILNNLKELWTVFDWVTAGRALGDLKGFTASYAKAIEAAREARASGAIVRAGERANARLQAALRPHFLQRLKSEYLADMLPPKTEIVVWTHLSAAQRARYSEFVTDRHGLVRNILLGRESSPLVALTWLKKLCGHPLLVEKKDANTTSNEDAEDGLQHRSSNNKRSGYDRDFATDIDEILHQSAKLELLRDLVRELVIGGHRTLIFSQSTRMLDIIAHVLQDVVRAARIDGSTQERDRQGRVDAFNLTDRYDVLLLSTKAAGVGLTLVGADRVIVYDPSWTPAEDSQAVDRAYRIGQHKPVVVYRLIAAGTVEEKMYEKQIHKDGIRRTVFGTGGKGRHVQRYFDRDELRNLFLLGDEGRCAVMDKVARSSSGVHGGEEDPPEGWMRDHAFARHHPCCVGLSRHDGFYQPNNSAGAVEIDGDDDDDENLPVPRKNLGKAQRILQKENTNPQQLSALGSNQYAFTAKDDGVGAENNIIDLCDEEDDDVGLYNPFVVDDDAITTATHGAAGTPRRRTLDGSIVIDVDQEDDAVADPEQAKTVECSDDDADSVFAADLRRAEEHVQAGMHRRALQVLMNVLELRSGEEFPESRLLLVHQRCAEIAQQLELL
jgi:DNA excision repair protein ERCC-6-like